MSATTRGEADADEDWRGASALPQHIPTPCGVCCENMEILDAFTFSRWAIHPRCALNTAEGAVDAGEDKLRIAAAGEAGLSKRGAIHLVDFLPELRMSIDGAANGGVGQQLRIALLWEDVSAEVGDERDERDGGWKIRGRPVVVVGDELCSYYGWALDDPHGVWGA